MAKNNKNIESFTRSNIKDVRAMIQKKLDELEELGVKVHLGNIRYNDYSISGKIIAEPANFSKQDPKDVFVTQCAMYGMSAKEYNSSFFVPTKRGQVKVGFERFDASKRKFPIIVSDGSKTFKMSVSDYRKFSGAASVPTFTRTVNHGIEI